MQLLPCLSYSRPTLSCGPKTDLTILQLNIVSQRLFRSHKLTLLSTFSDLDTLLLFQNVIYHLKTVRKSFAMFLPVARSAIQFLVFE